MHGLGQEGRTAAERVGCLLVVTASPEEAVSVNGQLKAIVRPMYSAGHAPSGKKGAHVSMAEDPLF